ncbi:hypothetical protein KEM54_004083 [Ascosphaera aggregata]|nr:hypothetical protein KEM54_004083 [Ascosphaera aggregata]
MTSTPQTQGNGSMASRSRTYYAVDKHEKAPAKSSSACECSDAKGDPLEIPQPSDEYFTRVAEPPKVLDKPRRLFVVLDLNRTLIYRPAMLGKFIRRPYLEQFMETIVEDHNAMIWTTSKPDTVKQVLPSAFKGRIRRKLCDVWDRKSFGLNKLQYNSKTQVYKDLDKVWMDIKLQRKREEQTKLNRKKLPQTKIIRGFWNQSNTVLVDDSWQKGLPQPFNMLEVPALRENNADDTVTLRTVLRQLRVLSYYSDVSCKIREWIARRDELFRPHADGSPFVLAQGDYNWFWNNVLSLEEGKLGLKPYEFPKRNNKDMS